MKKYNNKQLSTVLNDDKLSYLSNFLPIQQGGINNKNLIDNSESSYDSDKVDYSNILKKKGNDLQKFIKKDTKYNNKNDLNHTTKSNDILLNQIIDRQNLSKKENKLEINFDNGEDVIMFNKSDSSNKEMSGSSEKMLTNKILNNNKSDNSDKEMTGSSDHENNSPKRPKKMPTNKILNSKMNINLVRQNMKKKMLLLLIPYLKRNKT